MCNTHVSLYFPCDLLCSQHTHMQTIFICPPYSLVKRTQRHASCICTPRYTRYKSYLGTYQNNIWLKAFSESGWGVQMPKVRSCLLGRARINTFRISPLRQQWQQFWVVDAHRLGRCYKSVTEKSIYKQSWNLFSNIFFNL